MPDANISWIHNGNPIDTTLSKYEMAEKDSLRIAHLKTSDSGVYREQYNYYGCIFYDITNVQVSGNKSFNVFPFYSPRYIIIQ